MRSACSILSFSFILPFFIYLILISIFKHFFLFFFWICKEKTNEKMRTCHLYEMSLVCHWTSILFTLYSTMLPNHAFFIFLAIIFYTWLQDSQGTEIAFYCCLELNDFYQMFIVSQIAKILIILFSLCKCCWYINKITLKALISCYV